MTIDALQTGLALRDPILVGAFMGWADASSGASGAVRFLVESLGAERLATWDGDDYYDFVELRPVSRTVDGRDRALDWPHGEFWLVRDVRTSLGGLSVDREETVIGDGQANTRSVILFVAPEPRMRWRAHSREMAAFLAQYGVRQAVFFGSAFADVPHTRPSLVTGWATDPSLRVRLEMQGVPFSPYQGPSSMQSATIEGLRQSGVSCVSLFSNGPHYLPVPNPNLSLALLRRMCAVFDLAIDLSSLRENGAALVTQADAAVAERSELREHVQRLEAQYDQQAMPFAPGETLRIPNQPVETADEPRGLEVDSQALVADLEAFLRSRAQDGPTELEPPTQE